MVLSNARVMQQGLLLKIAIVSAAAFFISISGAEAITLSASDEIPAVRSEAVKVQCVSGSGALAAGAGVVPAVFAADGLCADRDE